MTRTRSADAQPGDLAVYTAGDIVCLRARKDDDEPGLPGWWIDDLDTGERSGGLADAALDGDSWTIVTADQVRAMAARAPSRSPRVMNDPEPQDPAYILHQRAYRHGRRRITAAGWLALGGLLAAVHVSWWFTAAVSAVLLADGLTGFYRAARLANDCPYDGPLTSWEAHENQITEGE